MKRNIISEYFEQKRRLRDAFQMKDTGKLSATTYLWTSPNSFAIMAVTATWLTSNFRMKEVTLSFRELPVRHNGGNIAKAFFSVLEEFSITDRVLRQLRNQSVLCKILDTSSHSFPTF